MNLYRNWIEDEGVGIKLTPDTRTTTLMRKGLNEIQENPRIFSLFKQIHSEKREFSPEIAKNNAEIKFQQEILNQSQKNAVGGMLDETQFCIIHGPPGTGKTVILPKLLSSKNAFDIKKLPKISPVTKFKVFWQEHKEVFFA